MRQQLLTDFIRRVWSDGDVEACDDYLAARYAIAHDPGDPWDGRVLDLTEFKERLRQSRVPFPDQQFDIREWFENADGVMISWDWQATHMGDLPGFPATGKVVTMSGSTIYYFDGEDRIFGHWQIADRLGIYQQLRQADIPKPKSFNARLPALLSRKRRTLATYGLV